MFMTGHLRVGRQTPTGAAQKQIAKFMTTLLRALPLFVKSNETNKQKTPLGSLTSIMNMFFLDPNHVKKSELRWTCTNGHSSFYPDSIKRWQIKWSNSEEEGQSSSVASSEPFVIVLT